MPRVQRIQRKPSLLRMALMAILAGFLCVPFPISPATITGSTGDPVYLTEPDTLDVKHLKQDGVPVVTQNIIGYGTVAERDAVLSTDVRYWWVTDGQPPYFSRFSGEVWETLRTDPTWPVATQSLQAAHQILGCGTDRSTIRMVYVQGDGGPITLTSNPQIPAGSDGQVCVLWGTSATDTLTVADGNGLELDGLNTYTVSTTQSLTLAYSTITSRWRQIASSTSAGGAGGSSPPGLTVGTTLSGLSGASVTATNLIPADSWVVGVTISITTGVTGATGINVGDATDPTHWGENISVTQGTVTDIGDFLAAGPSYYPVATNVVLRAVGSNFSGGTVAVTVYYMTLSSFVNGGGGGTEAGLPPGGNSDAILKRNGTNSGLEWGQILGTDNQIDVQFAPGSITLSTPQDLATTSSPIWAGQTIVQGTLPASTPVTHTAGWNNPAVTFVHRSNEVTNLNSGANSLLEQWTVNGVNKVSFRKDGEVKASTTRLGLVTITAASYTVAADVTYVLCDATAQAVDITLPSVSVRGAGSDIYVQKIDDSANPCRVNRAGSDTIQNTATQVIFPMPWQGAKFVAGGGTKWYVW